MVLQKSVARGRRVWLTFHPMGIDIPAVNSELNSDDTDHRFYAALADEVDASAVLDLGCGTGTLARLLASAGRSVVGIDPDPDMLRYAAAAPGGDRVEWRLGYSALATSDSADLAVMSGHVAQVFRDRDSWTAALRDLHRALVAGGTLAFESRNPEARAWEKWTRAQTLRVVVTPAGPVEVWHETETVTLPLVAFDTFTRNLVTGEETVTRDVLAFRPVDDLVKSLRETALSVSRVLGDWDGRPFEPLSPEVIVVATKRPPEPEDGQAH